MEIRYGDQRSSGFAAISRQRRGCCPILHVLRRVVRRQAACSARTVRCTTLPPLRLISGLTVDGARPSTRAIDRTPGRSASPRQICSREAALGDAQRPHRPPMPRVAQAATEGWTGRGSPDAQEVAS